jgi:hypothetical protein
MTSKGCDTLACISKAPSKHGSTPNNNNAARKHTPAAACGGQPRVLQRLLYAGTCAGPERQAGRPADVLHVAPPDLQTLAALAAACELGRVPACVQRARPTSARGLNLTV